MPVHQVQAFTYQLREGLLPLLAGTLIGSGAWILDQKTLSPSTVEISLEIHLRRILDLYAAFAVAGIEPTRQGRHTLTSLCTRSRSSRDRRIGEVVSLRFELRFLEDVPLQSLRATQTCVV